jgi:hypothetical protein
MTDSKDTSSTPEKLLYGVFWDWTDGYTCGGENFQGVFDDFDKAKACAQKELLRQYKGNDKEGTYFWGDDYQGTYAGYFAHDSKPRTVETWPNEYVKIRILTINEEE